MLRKELVDTQRHLSLVSHYAEVLIQSAVAVICSAIGGVKIQFIIIDVKVCHVVFYGFDGFDRFEGVA